MVMAATVVAPEPLARALDKTPTGAEAMEHTGSSYGLWTLVVLNVAIFVMFAFSFFKPASARATGAVSGRSQRSSWRCSWRCMASR